MTALEMQFASLHEIMHFKGTSRTPQVDSEWVRLVENTLRSAECFSWNRETTIALTLAAKSVPADVVFRREILPSASGWWWLDSPIAPRIGSEERLCSAFMWGPDTGRVGVWGFAQDEASWFHNRAIPVFDFSIDEGESISNIIERQRIIATQKGLPDRRIEQAAAMARVLIAGCMWLQQKVVASSLGHVERHRRKQLAREHNAPVPSDVKVIQLRRTESQSQHANGNGESIDWSCRWIVNGHWRNQPYKDERKLIYILPYVKGPDDKPLKVPTHTVYQVSR